MKSPNPQTAEQTEKSFETGPSVIVSAYERVTRAELEVVSAIRWLRAELDRMERDLAEPWRSGSKLENGHVLQRPSTVGEVGGNDWPRLLRALVEVDQARLSAHAIETVLADVEKASAALGDSGGAKMRCDAARGFLQKHTRR